jgi:hypothetical protein
MMTGSMKPLTLIVIVLASVLAAEVYAAPEDDFGRLFSRPAERRNLDILRQNQKLKVITPQDLTQPDLAESAAPAELPDPITLQGFVKRSDGASTLWINNKAVQEGSAVDNVEIGKLNRQRGNAGTSSESLNVRIPANGKHIRLKAGQVYMPDINQIREMKLLEKQRQLNLQETGVIGSDEKSLQ